MTATQVLEVLASYSLQILIVMTTGRILERAVGRSTDRCAIWQLCFVSTLCLGCTALLLPRLHFFRPWSLLEPSELLAVTAAQAIAGKVLLAMWSFGASLLLLKWALRSYFWRRSLTRCELLPRQQVRMLLATADTQIADHELPVLLISDESEGPYCWQLHRPAIVLPRFLLEGNQADLRNVLIHELEHLRTNHSFQLFLQQLVQILCWFHPSVWNAAWHASLAREFTCDDAVAARGTDSAAYLRTLLQIAERQEQGNHASVISFGKTPSELVLRAHRLVKLAKQRRDGAQRGLLGRKAAISVLLVITCIVSQAWLSSDPLTSARSLYSPWPAWTARVLHCFGGNFRDYEPFDRHVQLYELQRYNMEARATHCESLAQESHRRS